MRAPSSSHEQPTRRDVLRTAAAGALAGVAVPAVHAGESNTIRLAIVGSGSRGTGALINAMTAPGGPVKLVAMADIFPDKLERSLKTVTEQFPDKVDVPPERRFLGFDAYKKAIDCLSPGDIVLLTTQCGYRVPHFEYAVSKGVNAFLEKSFAPDPGGLHRVLAAGVEADRKNLKVACGLMCRHSVARQAMIEKIRDGAMGRIELVRAYRLGGSIAMGPYPSGESEVLWQLRRPSSFHWVSGGLFSEMTIHQIDEVCWLHDAMPVSAHGLGGRVPGSTDASENLDSYSIEYTFPNGGRAIVQGRYLNGAHGDFATYVDGSKAVGQFSGNIHAATVHICKDRRLSTRNIAWRPDAEPCDPWQAEWNDFLAAIRADRPYNEIQRSAMSNFAGILGRAAVHLGSVVTWDEVFNSKFQFCPDVLALSETTPPPSKADASGRYKAPVPGSWKEF
jgi:predicted dehydrogenase